MVCPWRWVLVSLQSFHHLASDLLDLGHALPRNLAPIPDVLLEAEEDLRHEAVDGLPLALGLGVAAVLPSSRV